MNSLLQKIAQLNSTQEVLFLSSLGEPLFVAPQQSPATLEQNISLWNALIDDLDRPICGEFLFANGRYCLQSIGIGEVIVGMGSDINLKSIRTALANAQEKLADRRLGKKVLLKMFSQIDYSLLPNLINALTPFADAEVASSLAGLLEEEANFPEQNKDRLLLALTNAFAHCPPAPAVPALQNIQRICHSDHGEARRGIDLAVNNALRRLETLYPGAVQATLPETSTREQTEPLPEEQRIGELLDQQRTTEATQLIMQMISESSRAGRFQTAERLRDWLLRVDSGALSEVIRAAEIIDQAKSAAVDPKHLATWRELTEALSQEEFVALYHAMRQKEYPAGEIIARQGELLPLLFFVNQGRLELYAVSQDQKVPLQFAGAGDVVGRESFFEFSVWTVNMVSLGAQVAILSRKDLEEFEESLPALHGKLFSFCSKFLSANSLFRKTRKNRRQFERIALSGNAAIKLLDSAEKENGVSTRGRLIAISRKGVAAAVRFPSKKIAEEFLNRWVNVDIRPDKKLDGLQCRGKIVALRCQDFVGNDYSIHIELSEELSDSLFSQLIS
jgi:CRP-like cAMP-binding protein